MLSLRLVRYFFCRDFFSKKISSRPYKNKAWYKIHFMNAVSVNSRGGEQTHFISATNLITGSSPHVFPTMNLNRKWQQIEKSSGDGLYDSHEVNEWKFSRIPPNLTCTGKHQHIHVWIEVILNNCSWIFVDFPLQHIS